MKKILLIALLFIYTDSFCQSERQIFEYPNLKSLISTAKKVAILPFNVSISYEKIPKGMSLDQIKDNEKAESIQMQQGMYTYLLRKLDNYDSALPSGNSVMAFNLKYLSEIFQIEGWKAQSIKMLNSIYPFAIKHPNSFAFWCFQIINQSVENYQIVITGKENSEMRSSVNEMYIPNKVLQSTETERKYPLLDGKRISEYSSQMHICGEKMCYEPQQSLTLIRLLTKN
jgi:uncharacterized protein YyaL (SSP411 family)